MGFLGLGRIASAVLDLSSAFQSPQARSAGRFIPATSSRNGRWLDATSHSALTGRLHETPRSSSARPPFLTALLRIEGGSPPVTRLLSYSPSYSSLLFCSPKVLVDNSGGVVYDL